MGIGDWRGKQGGRPTSLRRPAERATSIAVLAFTDMSAAKDQDWFCDGIAEEILNALAPLKGLRVAARTSAFSFKGKGDDLRTIGEKLNVTTVLEGSVRRAGDRVRITVQLSEVANGFQLWSERYDRELKDIFDVQDEIAKAIAERLRVTLAGGNDDRLVEQATTNIEAYQLYLKGRALLDRRGASIPAGARSVPEGSRTRPRLFAGLGRHRRRVHRAGVSPGPREALSRNHRRWRRRHGRSSSIPRPRRATPLWRVRPCCTRTTARWRSRSSSERWSSVRVTRWAAAGTRTSISNWARGDFEQGIAEARRALDSDPLSAYVTMILGVCLFTAGRLDEAIDTCRRAIQLDPESFVARWALGVALGTGWTIRRGGLHARGCRRDVGAPLARPHRPGWSLRAVGESRRRRSPCIAN